MTEGSDPFRPREPGSDIQYTAYTLPSIHSRPLNVAGGSQSSALGKSLWGWSAAARRKRTAPEVYTSDAFSSGSEQYMFIVGKMEAHRQKLEGLHFFL